MKCKPTPICDLLQIDEAEIPDAWDDEWDDEEAE
jgi:hypothetical protein